jgi:hypothetical protein
VPILRRNGKADLAADRMSQMKNGQAKVGA